MNNKLNKALLLFFACSLTESHCGTDLSDIFPSQIGVEMVCNENGCLVVKVPLNRDEGIINQALKAVFRMISEERYKFFIESYPRGVNIDQTEEAFELHEDLKLTHEEIDAVVNYMKNIECISEEYKGMYILTFKYSNHNMRYILDLIADMYLRTHSSNSGMQAQFKLKAKDKLDPGIYNETEYYIYPSELTTPELVELLKERNAHQEMRDIAPTDSPNL